MSLQRLICDSNEQLVHTDDQCLREQGRVRGVILFDTAFDIDGLIAKLQSEDDADSVAVVNLINAGITDGTVYIIPQTAGTYNGGDAHTADGYLDGETRVLWYNHELQFTDPSLRGNRVFWQRAELRQWYIGWRTESLLQISNTPANIRANNPVEDNLNSTVAWKAVATWRSKDKPEILPLTLLADYFGDNISAHEEPASVPVPHRSAEWGHIIGNITEQTDLQSALNSKADRADIPTIPDIPTRTSQLTNDSGYLTEHQDISGKQDKTDNNLLNPRFKNIVGAINDNYIRKQDTNSDELKTTATRIVDAINEVVENIDVFSQHVRRMEKEKEDGAIIDLAYWQRFHKSGEKNFIPHSQRTLFIRPSAMAFWDEFITKRQPEDCLVAAVPVGHAIANTTLGEIFDFEDKEAENYFWIKENATAVELFVDNKQWKTRIITDKEVKIKRHFLKVVYVDGKWYRASWRPFCDLPLPPNRTELYGFVCKYATYAYLQTHGGKKGNKKSIRQWKRLPYYDSKNERYVTADMLMDKDEVNVKKYMQTTGVRYERIIRRRDSKQAARPYILFYCAKECGIRRSTRRTKKLPIGKGNELRNSYQVSKGVIIKWSYLYGVEKEKQQFKSNIMKRLKE